MAAAPMLSGKSTIAKLSVSPKNNRDRANFLQLLRIIVPLLVFV
jgi:hypothetical protein